MANEIQQSQLGSSPFDSIRRTKPDGSEYWSARELMSQLGYTKWQSMEEVIGRSRSACRNSGHNQDEHFASVSSIFTNDGKNSKSFGRPGLDVSLSRYACYLVAMNGDPDKVEIAAAQQYFALKTREAELASTTNAVFYGELPWSIRYRESTSPHCCHLNVHHPGYWSVVSASAIHILTMEDILYQHCLPIKPGDLPDGSIGRHWSTHRKSLGRAPATRFAPLLIPARGINVMVSLYPFAELGEYQTWFLTAYLPIHLPSYFNRKPEFRPHGKLPSASAADRTCQRIAQKPAALAPKVRRQLTEAGGFVTADPQAPAIEYQQKRLFD